MFRNYLAAALRNIARNRLYAALNIVGLAVGFAAAMLIASYVRHEVSFERFIQGYDETYRLSGRVLRVGAAGDGRLDDVRGPIVEDLLLAFPQIQHIASLRRSPEGDSLRRGDVEAVEQSFYWADPDVFAVLPLPAVAGDPRKALQRPDGLVLTRRMARKFFGTDVPIEQVVGQTIEVNRQYTMRVAAVLEDLPSSTHLNTEIFASSLALPPVPSGMVYRCFVYLRLTPGADPAQFRAALPAFVDRHTPPPPTGRAGAFDLVPIADIHLRSPGRFAMKPAGDPNVLAALSLVGALILLIAAINYINLMTARGSRRAVEVGVRKAAGASQLDLIVQFIGESVIYSALGVLAAVMLVELALPPLNGFLDRDIRFDYSAPPVIATLAGLALVVGILAGAYPALVLSSFKPASVLKGKAVPAVGSGKLRQGLVLLQFSILIGLIVVTGIISGQTTFGLRSGLRFDHDQLLSIVVPPQSCERSPFASAVRALPGVRGTACSMEFLTNFGTQQYRAADGREVTLQNVTVGAGMFELLGLRPLAGRFFDRGRESDMLPDVPMKRDLAKVYRTVVNETAARELGFSSPRAAIGQVFTSLSDVRAGTRREIIGVVPDFARESVRAAIQPAFYDYMLYGNRLNVKLNGAEVSATLMEIDRLWQRMSPAPSAISRTFYDAYVESMYRDLERQGALFSIFATLALLLATMGLFGLASFTVERRTLEIGVRKALGASTFDLIRLLLWQFAKPVLAANLIAWPVAAWLMSRWLNGFAYRIDMPLWLFPTAAVVALVISTATVSGHSLRVSREPPVKALKYE